MFSLIVFLVIPKADAQITIQQMHKIADNGGRCAWSPAGDDRIAFDRKNPRDGYYDLWVMNADGSNPICLTDPSPAGFPLRHAGNPSWHPSGKYILVNAEKQANPAVGKRAIEPYCEPGIGRNNDLWLIAADGSRAWLLWENPTPKSIFAPQPALYNARFNHDGTQIAWTHSPKGSRGTWGDYEIRVADFSLEPTPHINRKSVKTYRPAPAGNFHEVHGWSPDDRTLDVSGNWRGQPEYDQDIGVLDLSTGDIVNLTPTPVHTWTEAVHSRPGGKSRIYMSSEEYTLQYDKDKWWEWLKTDYWVIRPDGTGRRRLTYFNDPAHAEYTGDIVNVAQFSWNPDGAKFCGVLNRTRPGQRGALEIWVFELAGREK
ncbi:hypothetical protein HY522_07815 [bacterium]|nr:hypothetical protein [bacterium]